MQRINRVSDVFISLIEALQSKFHNIGIKAFEKSSFDVVAVELLRRPKDWADREVDLGCVQQLLRIINYAHDRGGKKLLSLMQLVFP